MPLLALLGAAALALPAPYEVQETQKWHGKTLLKQYLGWKYHLDTDSKSIAAKTLRSDGRTRLIFFDEKTGQPYATNTFVDLTDYSPLLTPAPLGKNWRK